MIKDLTIQNIENIYHARGRSVDLSPGISLNGLSCRMETLRAGVVSAWWEYSSDAAAVCIKGNLKAVFFDARRDSPTFGEVNIHYTGDTQCCRLTIPVGVYTGWQNSANDEAWLFVVSADLPKLALPPENDFIPHRW